jgi:hypothetical protein
MVTWVSNRDGKVLSSTPDRAAADDHGPVPDLGEVRRLSVGPHRLAGQSHDGRDDWFASGGDEDVVCADIAIGDGDSARAGERGAALDDGDALVLVAGHLGGVVEVTDQVVAVIAQIGPVQVRGGNTLVAVRLGPPAPAAASWMGRRPSRRIHRPIRYHCWPTRGGLVRAFGAAAHGRRSRRHPSGGGEDTAWRPRRCAEVARRVEIVPPVRAVARGSSDPPAH